MATWHRRPSSYVTLNNNALLQSLSGSMTHPQKLFFNPLFCGTAAPLGFLYIDLYNLVKLRA